jgi:hypothetical protein
MYANKNENSLSLFAWVSITVLFLALATAVIKHEDEVGHLRAHIELLSQACK